MLHRRKRRLNWIGCSQIKSGALIFSYWVRDPERYGVVEFDPSGKVLSIEEMPKAPKSSFAASGHNFCDEQVVEIASGLKLSARGELENADVLNVYRSKGNLKVKLLGRGFAWLDIGTHDSLCANLRSQCLITVTDNT
jgi:glucose-1-phosphate thymidylyltransferase